MFCLLIVIPLDFVQLFVGNVGGHHILDLHGYLGVGLDDTIGLDLNSPDSGGGGGGVLSPCQHRHSQCDQAKEHDHTNQADS